MRVLLFLFTLLFFTPLLADASDQGFDGVRQGLNRFLPGLKVGAINRTPLPGVYEVQFGQRIAYVSEDGRFLLQGNLIDIEQQKNLTEPRLDKIKADALAAIDEKNMLSFGPADAKDTVTVFTDIDCGYCRKLHREIDSYGEKGIRIRYLFFPRAGIGSESYDKAVSVWCADDPKQAMTDAKSGKKVDSRVCDNPVRHDWELGQEMGISGTPAIVLESGKLIPGYIPADRLSAIIKSSPE